MQGHRFEVYGSFSEIHENLDLVLGIKDICELAGVTNSRESCFSLWNRAVPFFPNKKVILKPKEQRFIKIEAPFRDEITGLYIVSMLDINPQSTRISKIKFIRNLPILMIQYISLEAMTLSPQDILWILDLSLIDYNEIKHGVYNQTLVDSLDLNQQIHFVNSLINW